MKYRNAIAAPLLALLLAGPTWATPSLLVDADGILTGATDVEVVVAGVTRRFDVSFVSGSCPAVFAGCDQVADFDFHDVDSATAAAGALLGQVFVDDPVDPARNFNSAPNKTRGCGSPIECTVYVPYGLADENLLPIEPWSHWVTWVLGRGAWNEDPDQFFGDRVVLYQALFPTNPATVYARFTPSAADVPEPSIGLLLALGLAGLWGSRRRR